jgi:sugar/nucleoside kinase (ribokinase family)
VDDVPAAIDADALFVSGFALFQSGSADAAALVIERCTGRWIGIDVASPKLAIIARGAHIATAGRETVVFATAEEAEAMTRRSVEGAAHELASRFSIACIKLGEEGAVAAAGSELERRSAEKLTRRSSFGAGDAFAGAFLVAIAAGSPLGPALQLACDTGAKAGAVVS